MASQARKAYTVEFKREAVALVTEQGYTLVARLSEFGDQPGHAAAVEARNGYCNLSQIWLRRRVEPVT